VPGPRDMVVREERRNRSELSIDFCDRVAGDAVAIESSRDGDVRIAVPRHRSGQPFFEADNRRVT
jgi:hypothetical protein